MTGAETVGLPVGAPLPDVTLGGPDGPVALHDLAAGTPLVIAFYVEDQTPTCSAQLCAFRDDYDLIEELGAIFVGISADDAASHARFREAQQFPFPLLVDPNLEAARAFRVVDETGKRSIRALFVIDENSTVQASIPYYNPANGDQYQAVFAALGLELE